jgi:hypothetical protein
MLFAAFFFLPKMQSSLHIILENMKAYLNAIGSAHLHIQSVGDLQPGCFTALENELESQLQAPHRKPSHVHPPPSPLLLKTSIEINSNNFEDARCVTDELISRRLNFRI